MNRGGILGRGWAFPPTFDAVFRTVEMVDGVENVEQNLRILLETYPGERTMLPDYGTPFQEFIFAEINPVTISELRDAVRRAILTYEPRIDLDAVEVEVADAERGTLLVSIDYTIRRVNSRHNFVHPYHLREGTGLEP